MSLGIGQILLILVVVLIIFGAGKLPYVMKDLAKGLKAFKEGLQTDDDLQSPTKVNKTPKSLTAKRSKKPPSPKE